MNRLQLVLGMAVSVLVGSPTWAIPSAYDGFDYANDSVSLDGQTGGYGWDGPWREIGGPASFQSIPSNNDVSLTLPTLPFSPIGDHIVATGPGTGGNTNHIARTLRDSFSLAEDNTFYASYLFQKNGAAAGASANNLEFNLYDGSSVTLRMGSSSNNTFFLGAADNAVATPLSAGQTYFVVAKIVASASGTDVASAMLFDASRPIPALEPGVFDLTFDIQEDRGNHVVDTARFWIGTNAVGAYDELRLGRTWQDVTSTDPNFQLGDFDLVGGIQPADYQILASNLYTGTTYEQGDIDFSGLVDLTDFAIFREIYTSAGFTLPPGAPGTAVPEPATLLVVAAAALALPYRLRRRKSA